MTTLPLFYTYGLSVLNTHLRGGATCRAHRATASIERDFWDSGRPVRRHLAGRGALPVRDAPPAALRSREDTRRCARSPRPAAGWARAGRPTSAADARRRRPALRHVRPDRGDGPDDHAAARRACRRSSARSAGRSRRPAVDPAETASRRRPEVVGEVVYHGPNVMMGYAGDADDLARGGRPAAACCDRRPGPPRRRRLPVPSTGRIKRIGQVFGVRVNLDDVEQLLRPRCRRRGGDGRRRRRSSSWTEGGDCDAPTVEVEHWQGACGCTGPDSTCGHRGAAAAAERQDRLPRRWTASNVSVVHARPGGEGARVCCPSSPR